MATRKLLASAGLWLLPLLVGCSNMLYYPTRSLYVDVERLRPPPEEREVTLKDGLTVHGWYFHAQAQPAHAVVVFFHGNGQNRSAHFLTLYDLVRHGYDLVIFDYPGYGQTKGSPSPENTVETAMQVIRMVHSREPNLPLVVYGQSLGGTIAMRATWELRSEIKPSLLVVDSSFLSYRSAARQVLSHSAWTWALQPVGWLVMSDQWAPAGRLGDIEGTPVIVIHSHGDHLIPYELGEEVFASARQPKWFWSKEAGGHNETYEGEEGHALKEKLLQALPK